MIISPAHPINFIGWVHSLNHYTTLHLEVTGSLIRLNFLAIHEQWWDHCSVSIHDCHISVHQLDYWLVVPVVGCCRDESSIQISGNFNGCYLLVMHGWYGWIGRAMGNGQFTLVMQFSFFRLFWDSGCFRSITKWQTIRHTTAVGTTYFFFIVVIKWWSRKKSLKSFIYLR